MIKKMVKTSMVILMISLSLLSYSVDVKYEVQDPKGATMALVSFEHKLFNFQFDVKYPESWYASEEYGPGVSPSLYLTKEPVRSMRDQFKTGAAISYWLNFFISEEPKDSDLGKTAKSVLNVRKWDSTKKELVENYKKQGMNIITQEDTTISGWPALMMECESATLKLRVYFIKAGVHMLTITCESTPTEFPEYDPVFKEIVNSFSFNKDFQPPKEEEVFETKMNKVIGKGE